MGIPSILAAPFPMTPTKEYPAIIFYDRLRLGRTVNKLTHHIFEKGFWKMANTGLKKYWIQKYERLPKDFSNPYPKQRTASHPSSETESRRYTLDLAVLEIRQMPRNQQKWF
jgi:sterol 3beta-glucosyltransferase